MARVLVALSGGVDSAVAAALLLEQGHEVTGVHLRLADLPADRQVPGQGCCTLDDAQDARRVAQQLDVPFYALDLSATFRREVEEPFVAAYAAGVTPNPCVTCNERVKYAELLDRAIELGFDALATGHHARLRRDGLPVTRPGAGASLLRGADVRKDQSYVLYVARPGQLARTLLPVGELTKDEVRQAAAGLGLRVADKPDSYDVCFVPRGDTAGYLADRLPAVPGPIVDGGGRVVGHHEGVWRYTVGQRRGLALDAPARDGGAGRPARRFVTDLDARTATVRVGPREELACHWVELGAGTWTTDLAPAGEVRVQVRAHGRSVPGRLTGAPSAPRLELAEAVHGVALGQAAVVYDADDEVCLGGGRIVRAQRPAGLPVAAGTGPAQAGGGAGSG